MPIFGQVWLWSSLAFLLGALLCWLLVARPARNRVGELEAQLATQARRQSAPERPEPSGTRSVVPGFDDRDDSSDHQTRGYRLQATPPPPLPPERDRLAPYPAAEPPEPFSGGLSAPPEVPETELADPPRAAATQYLDVSAGSLTAPPEVPAVSQPPSDRGWFDDELDGDAANQAPEDQPAVPRNRHHLAEPEERFDARLVDDVDEDTSISNALDADDDEPRPAVEDESSGTVFTQRTHPIPGEMIRQIDEAGKQERADNLVDDLADDVLDNASDRRERTVESEPVDAPEPARPYGDQQSFADQPFTDPKPFDGSQPLAAQQSFADEQRLADEQRFGESTPFDGSQPLAAQQSFADEQRLAEEQRFGESTPFDGSQPLAAQQSFADEQRFGEPFEGSQPLTGQQSSDDQQRFGESQPLAAQQSLADEQRFGEPKPFDGSQPLAPRQSFTDQQRQDDQHRFDEQRRLDEQPRFGVPMPPAEQEPFAGADSRAEQRSFADQDPFGEPQSSGGAKPHDEPPFFAEQQPFAEQSRAGSTSPTEQRPTADQQPFTEPQSDAPPEQPQEQTEVVAAVPEDQPAEPPRPSSDLPRRVPQQNRITPGVAVRVDPTPNALPKRVPGKPRHHLPFGVDPTPEPAAPAAAAVEEPADPPRSLFEPIIPAADEGMSTPPPPHRLRQGSGGGRGPFGPGSAMPLPGGASPSPEFTIKASVAALRYCTPDSPQFGRTVAEVWFRTAADAERVGFRPVG